MNALIVLTLFFLQLNNVTCVLVMLPTGNTVLKSNIQLTNYPIFVKNLLKRALVNLLTYAKSPA